MCNSNDNARGRGEKQQVQGPALNVLGLGNMNRACLALGLNEHKNTPPARAGGAGHRGLGSKRPQRRQDGVPPVLPSSGIREAYVRYVLWFMDVMIRMHPYLKPLRTSEQFRAIPPGKTKEKK